MASRSASLPEATPTAVAAWALGTAALVGGLMTVSVPAGTALLLGACYAPLALVNLRLGLALWVPLTFLEGRPSARRRSTSPMPQRRALPGTPMAR